MAGGVAVIEVKRSKDGESWHPHLHLLVESRYIDERELSGEWHLVTKTSFIVDVRAPKPGAQFVRYVTKYITKPCTVLWTRYDGLFDEAVLAFDGRRVVTPFGTWYHIRLKSEENTSDWIPVAPLRELLERSRRGDAVATGILELVRRTEKCEDQDLLTGVPP